MTDTRAAGERPELVKRLWRRRSVRVAVISTAVLAPLGSGGGAWGFRYIRTDPRFCVSCHLMAAPAERWRHSAHKDVACQTCHKADIFEEASLGYAAIIERKKAIGSHAKLDIEICESCHLSSGGRWPEIAKTPGHRSHALRRDISCLQCHATRVHEFKADAGRCIQCHGAEHLRLKKMETLHCLGCHDFLGKKGASDLPTALSCRECHAASADAKPAVANPDLAGKAAPVGKGHEDCLGCHRPHGKPLDDPLDCLACHRKLLDSSSKHYKDERLQSCLECHEPHKP